MNGLSRLWKFLRQPIPAGPRRAFRGLWFLSLFVLLLAPGATALAQCEPPEPLPDCWNWDYALCELYPDYPEQYCEAGYVWNFCTGECDQDCSEPIGDPPLPCYEWSPAACAWVDGPPPPEGCPSGSHWANCECLPDEGCEQPPQEDPCSWWDPDECIYVHFPPPECPPGEIPGPNCDCLPCDPGPQPLGCYELSEDGCSWVPSEPTEPVPPGYIWNPDTCSIDRDCSVPDPAVPDPGSCYEYIPAACDYVQRDAEWNPWEWKVEPTLDLALPEGTPRDLDYWFTEGGSEVTVSVTVILSEDGERERTEKNDCYDDEVEDYTPVVEVNWANSGVTTEPEAGDGYTATFNQPGSGLAETTFYAQAPASDPPLTDTPKTTKLRRNGVELVTTTVLTSALPDSRVVLGLCEKVTCAIFPSPIGPVEWSSNEPGSLNPTEGATSTFTAPDAAPGTGMPVTVQAKLSPADIHSVIFTVIPPYKIYEFESIDVTKTSIGPPIQLSLFANAYLGPDSVHFGNIKQRESFCRAELVWGYFSDLFNRPHPVGAATWGNTIVAGKGTLLNVQDWMGSFENHPYYIDGGFIWDIPIEYQKFTGGNWRFLHNVRGTFTMEVHWEAVPRTTTLRIDKSLVNRSITGPAPD